VLSGAHPGVMHSGVMDRYRRGNGPRHLEAGFDARLA
jgi:hypothetical protein